MARLFNNNAANYLEVADVPAIDITGTQISIHAWVKLASVSVQQRLVSKWNNTSGFTQYLLYMATTGQIVLAVGPVGEQAVSVNSLTANTWQAVGGRKSLNGANGVAVFLQGVKEASATANNSIQNGPEPLRIGRGNNVSEQVNGSMAEVGIWDIALTDAEFLALAKGVSPLQIRRDHLKFYVPLFGVAHPEADLSGGGNNTTQNGTVAAAAGHPPVGRLAPFAG